MCGPVAKDNKGFTSIVLMLMSTLKHSLEVDVHEYSLGVDVHEV